MAARAFLFLMVTLFETIYSKKPTYITIDEALQRIKTGTSKQMVEAIRNGNSKLKTKLPAICWSGTFTERKDDALTKHSNLVVLDFDKLKDIRESQQELINYPFIYACWVSPSGNGLKALVKIADGNKHREHFEAIRQIFKQIDKSGINQSRVCFESYDPDIYINANAEVFTKILVQHKVTETTTDLDAFNKIKRWLEKKGEYFVQGNRNTYTFKLASACCRFGIHEQDTINLINSDCFVSNDFTLSELTTTVKSAYRANKNKFNTAAFEKDKLIEYSSSVEIELSKPKLEFPFEIFPEAIRKSIFDVASERSLDPVFLATAGLWTCSSLAGTAYSSDFGGDGKNILFCMMIAPISVGKTPAYKSMCETPLKHIQEQADEQFNKDLAEYNAAKVEAAANKQPFGKPKPRRFIPFAVDGTTEGYIALCMDQKTGIGVYHDEAETILNAGSFKSTNDSISFFTQAFSGGRFTQIRADRDKERVVQNLNINLLMGTQPSRLKNIFTEDRIANGFASRFLMVESDYIELNENADPFQQSRQMCNEWVNLLYSLYEANKAFNESDSTPIKVTITEEAKNIYRKFYKSNLSLANERIKNKHDAIIIGTEAKMSAYLPRLTQLIAIVNNPLQPIVNEAIVNLGYKLFKYYASSTVGIINRLFSEVDTGLPIELENLFNALPDVFTTKDAEDCCLKVNLKKDRFKVALRRKDFKSLFQKLEHGKYQKAL